MHFLTAKTTKQTAFLLPLEIPFSEWACDVTQVKKRLECSIGEITFLAKLAYSTIQKKHAWPKNSQLAKSFRWLVGWVMTDNIRKCFTFYFCWLTQINSFVSWQRLLSSTDSLCKQFAPVSAPTECLSWFGSKLFDILIVFLKEFFVNINFEKKS